MMTLGAIRAYMDAHPFALVILVLTAAFWLVGESRQGSGQRAEATEVDAGSKRLLVVTLRGGLLIAFVAPTVLPAATILDERGYVFWVGIALMWAGIGIRLWAFRTLGHYFTFTVMTSPNQKIVTTGPYRLLRHPSYAGGTLAFAGFGLAVGNWVSLGAVVALPLVGIVNRIKVEEAALLAAAGEPYRSFATGRKRMVPFIW